VIVSGPEAIGPERLAELVDGAAPRDEPERRTIGLLAAVRELEAGASEALRLRVLRAAATPAPAGAMERLRARLRSADRRTLALVAAPAAAAIAAAAVLLPVLTSGGPGRSGDAPAAEAPAAPSAQGAPAEGLARQAAAGVRVRVDGVEELSRARSRAMAVVHDLGGVTITSVDSVPGATRAVSRLVFRVPAARVDDAIAAFARLGTVTGRQAEARGAAGGTRADLATLVLTLAAARSAP
jgi:hypothetical protein